MSETKTKILGQALLAFNTQGVEAISLREIARELGISHGNLRYHYPGKDQIVKALFEQCLVESDQAIEDLLTESVTLEKLFAVSFSQAEKFWKYRFLMQDMHGICRQFPAVDRGMREMFNRRSHEMEQLLGMLRHQKLLKPFPFDGFFEMMMDNYMTVIDFGISFIELKYPSASEQEKIHLYHRMWFVPLIPLLTEEGTALLSPYLGGAT